MLIEKDIDLGRIVRARNGTLGESVPSPAPIKFLILTGGLLALGPCHNARIGELGDTCSVRHGPLFLSIK
jgi:hypothetical protein